MNKIKGTGQGDAEKLSGPDDVQEIRIGNERAVVVPLDTWESMLEELEEYRDLLCYDETCRSGDLEGDVIEHDELCRELGRCPLCYLRGQSGMSRAELAEKSSMSEAYIEKVETGQKCISKSAAKKLARTLGIEPEKLLHD